MIAEPRRVLVTGGTGLLGPDIVLGLLAAGYHVSVVSRRPPRWNHPKLSWITGDFSRDPNAVLQNLPQVDHVVHAGAMVRDNGSPADFQALCAANVTFTNQLFTWCDQHHVRKVIYFSSLSVLARPLRTPITETHPLGPTTPYSLTKLLGEVGLFRYASLSRFVPVVLRVTSPVATDPQRMHDTVVMKWLTAAQNNTTIRIQGSGNRSQDFVSCADVAAATVLALASEPSHGVYHVGSGTSLSLKQLAELIAAYRNTPMVFSPSEQSDDDRWVVSIQKARAEFGFEPRQSAADAIRTLAERVLA